MKRQLFNDGWEFCKTPVGTPIEKIEELSFSRVNLPHDFLIYNTEELYENATGWYRKSFALDKKDNQSYEIYFEGVYMDTRVYVNGQEIGEWKYGYSSFFFDITEALVNGENTIAVRIDHQSPNSRWYSGAGIYRDVYFTEYPKQHFVTDSYYVSAKPVTEGAITDETKLDGAWKLQVSAELVGLPEGACLRLALPEFQVLLEKPLTECIASKEDAQEERVELSVKVDAPELWSLENPKLYEVELSLLSSNGEVLDGCSTRMGFRSFTFDTNRGFFINGEHVKINGVCEHHDLGALGAAFHKMPMKRKFLTLRKMGVNAIRTSHNMPAVGLLDLADEMGFLVLDEAFDMWEGSKTEFDYGRFFKEWQAIDVRSWIRRDRNHPSIFMWSIGNEIYDTHKDAHGQEITRTLQSEARSHDFYENAVIGIGSNYMLWEGAQKCADILKYAGYNYAENLYNEHHEAHPDWYIFGSETSSTVQSRGIYHFPLSSPVLADDDEQCSSLGNSTTSWGAKNSEVCIIAERDHDFSMGQFLWTGFDYIGEPTPYQTRNSYFGQIDTAGFPKDSFYVYKSAWTDYHTDPFVHVFPYWDFNPGQVVDVRVVSNAPEVELLVNGVSQGRMKIDHAKGTKLSGDYSVVYVPGEITGVAYDENGVEIARQTRRSFSSPKKIVLTPWEHQEELKAGRDDFAFLEVTVEDENGNPVENATDLLEVSVEGAGYLAGLDNGDSTDTEQYKGNTKRLFSGKMVIIVGSTMETGDIVVTVSGDGLAGATYQMSVKEKVEIPGISLIPEVYENAAGKEQSAQKKWVRKIEIAAPEGQKLTPEKKEITVTAKIYPEEAAATLDAKDLIWKAVTGSGITSPVAKITKTEGLTASIVAQGDGEFKLRCMTKNGDRVVRVISTLDFTTEGFGDVLLNPYEFIAGGIWSYCEGELGNGNNHGVSMPRASRGVVGFENINFGTYGSDEITIPIFNLNNDPYPIQIWEGIPEQEGSTLLADVVYHKPSIWNVYQPDTYKLSKRLTGVTNLYFVTKDKAHIGGFSFKKLEKAYEVLSAASCDAVYGDAFEKREDSIDHIGNNVTVEFAEMDFGDEGAKKLTICGATTNPVNTIHVLFEQDGESCRDILEFTRDGGECQSFDVSGYKGKGTIRFVFLPGSQFDFKSLQFHKRLDAE